MIDFNDPQTMYLIDYLNLKHNMINYQTNFPTYPDTIAEYLGGLGNISLVDVNLDGYIDMYVNGSAKSK